MKKAKAYFSRLVGRVLTKLARQRMRQSPSRSLHNVLWERATEQSADFVENHMSSAMIFESKEEMWNYAATLVKEHHVDGFCFEFGVAAGVSINWLSGIMPKINFVGFDSFVGLKEDWIGHHAVKGAYSQGGVLPKVNTNVQLIPGWFDESLPRFLQDCDISRLRLVHIDGDTYEAAATVFSILGPHLMPGMFILFDELIGYPNWQNGEMKALNELQERFDLTVKFRAFSSEQALVEII